MRVLVVNRSLIDPCAQAAASTFNWLLLLQYCWFIWTVSLLSLSIWSSHNQRFDYSTAAICLIHVFPCYWPLILFLTGEQGIFNMGSDLCMLLCKVGTQADESTQVSTSKKLEKKQQQKIHLPLTRDRILAFLVHQSRVLTNWPQTCALINTYNSEDHHHDHWINYQVIFTFPSGWLGSKHQLT